MFHSSFTELIDKLPSQITLISTMRFGNLLSVILPDGTQIGYTILASNPSLFAISIRNRSRDLALEKREMKTSVPRGQ